MEVINFFGGPGTGKSTFAAKTFAHLKSKGYNCELVTEFAKDLVWSNRYDDLKDQIYVFAKQRRRMKVLDGKIDYLITDSPLLLSLIYGENESDEFKNLVRREHHYFKNTNIYLSRVHDYVEDGRYQNRQEAEDIDAKIGKILFEEEYMKKPLPEEPKYLDIFNVLFYTGDDAGFERFISERSKYYGRNNR